MIRATRRDRLVDLAVATASTVTLLAIVIAVPIGLAQVIGWPLPRALASPDAVGAALRYGQIAPSTVLRGLAVVLWIGWALLIASLGLEVVAVVRGTVARGVPGFGGFQRLASRLVAAAMLLSSVATRAGAAPPPIPPPSIVVAPPVTAGAPAPVASDTARDDADRTARRSTPSWTVRRHDSLWAIAERTLGDGRRWKEIVALNADRRQPDGRRLGRSSTLIHPGWRLALPADATVDATAASVVVAAGDDLWGLAERHLGDGELWTQLYATNRGRLQPDGARLLDPDLIRPGWTLQLPDVASHTDGPNEGAAPPDEAGTRRHHSGDAGVRAGRDLDEPADGPSPVRPRTQRGGATRSTSPKADRVPSSHDTTAGQRARTEPSAPPPPLPVTPGTLPPPSASERVADATGMRPVVAQRPTSAHVGRASPRNGRPAHAQAARDLAVLVGGSLLAAGLVALLTRRRKHWLRQRRHGEDMAVIDPEMAELERWLRSMADEESRNRIDRVLRVLSDHCDTHGVRPDVEVIEFGDDITVQLAAAVVVPPAVSPSADGRRWTLAAELDMASPSEAAERYVPTLVSCGRRESGALLLLNPLASTAVGVVGPDDQLQDVMTSWITELATGGAAPGVDVVVVGPHHLLVERLDRVTIVDDVDAAAARLEQVATDIHRSCVVLCHAAAVEDLSRLLRAAQHPRAGAVVFGREHTASTVALDGRRVVLRPDGTELDAPEWLTPDDWDRFGDLLRHPTARHTADPVSPLLSVVAPALEPFDDPAPPQAVVGVLGPLTIAGRPAPIGDSAAELLSYLAVHRTGGDPATLQCLLWPRHAAADERLASAVAAIDALFDDHDPVIVRTDDGRLELCDTVASDLARCEELTRGLDRRSPSAQARHLYAALDLVRGEPFASGAAWAHADGTALRVAGLVVDLAHRLAMHALIINDVERASWAVDRGLCAAPTNELLHRDRMRVADARGDTAALDVAMRDVRRLAEADGGWVTAETERCYRSLRGLDDAQAEEDAS